jgi:hypothetical protein
VPDLEQSSKVEASTMDNDRDHDQENNQGDSGSITKDVVAIFDSE